MRRERGAIDKVTVVNGALNAHVIGESLTVGICGSGLVDAASCMLDLELMDESGYLEDGSVTLAPNVLLTQTDVRMLQLAKSAIFAGVVTLLEESGVGLSDVPAVYIAGGFGHYLNMQNAARIGLLPSELVTVSRTVGNAALAGASALLMCKELRSEAERIAKGARTVDLSTNPIFSENYVSKMSF